MRDRQPPPKPRAAGPRRKGHVLLAFCALAGIVTSARAEVGGAATLIEWQAPAGCPDASSVYARLSDLLGQAPADWGRFERVRGTIRQEAEQWLLTIELYERGERMTRLISAPRCEDLAQAAAIAIALALDGDAQAPRAEHAQTSVAPARTKTAPEEAGRDGAANTRVAASAAGLRYALAAEGVLDVDSLGSLAAGASVLGALVWPRARLDLHGMFLPAQQRELGEAQSISFGLMAAGARACYRLLDGQAVAGACAGIEAGRLSVETHGLLDARAVNDLWLAPSVGLELGVRVTHALSAQLRLEILRPLPRKQYAVNETEVLYRPPALASRVYLGLSWEPD